MNKRVISIINKDLCREEEKHYGAFFSTVGNQEKEIYERKRKVVKEREEKLN